MSAPGMEPRRLTLIIAVLVALLPGAALACSCAWGGPFTRVALGTDLIALAEVRSYYRHSMDVTIVEVLRGIETRQAIRIWGDDGALCRPYVTAFPHGTRWIFALKRLPGPDARARASPPARRSRPRARSSRVQPCVRLRASWPASARQRHPGWA